MSEGDVRELKEEILLEQARVQAQPALNNRWEVLRICFQNELQQMTLTITHIDMTASYILSNGSAKEVLDFLRQLLLRHLEKPIKCVPDSFLISSRWQALACVAVAVKS